jgi:sulfate transport system ATP-binding protein
MISVHNVSKSFGDFVALDDVSLEVPSGALMALLGPSGSGKSTLLRVIAGLEQPDSGSVVISGKEATQLRPQQRGVGFVFQHYAPFKHMTVADNVAFGLTIRKRPKNEVRDRVDELLELVQLSGLGKRYPSQLSGGQRQRMALARALAVEPEVLLLDEPFGALDARVRQELRDWLRRLHDEVHVTTVFVTHDQEEAMQIADEIVLVNKGRIEQVGTGRDLYERPANEFVLTFVGEATWFEETLVRPHDVTLSVDPERDAVEVLVERIAYLGFEVRVKLALGDGRRFDAQLTREEAERLELATGQIVYARLGIRPQIRVSAGMAQTKAGAAGERGA